MISEKPSWIRHEGMQIFSIDIQPGGHRFATGGGDHKVRIWNMKPVDKEMDNNDSTPKLLAVLRDHFGSVNCVRWAKHGKYLASGSDDQVIFIHEKKPGSGTTEFGSGEPPDIENWKVAMTLRGHTADVVDLNWSPDDTMLASGSLDNTIHIWNMSNGICTAVLRGHSSLVKGVTWDPIGSFVASQSDDKTVIIWRTCDWTLAHRTEGHWAKSLGSTFFRRLGWSPCGHFITTTHGFQKPRHSAPVLERGGWSATFDFLGHNAPIIVVKFNHSMFKKSSSDSSGSKPLHGGWSNGTSKNGETDTQSFNVIAIGSQDRTITVWTTASPRPLFVAKHFFTQSVVDLSWSPDGYSLFACSLDGSIAIFHFEEKELGEKLTNMELDELKKSRYGDVRGRQTNLAESPAQLFLEAASAKLTTNKKITPEIQQNPQASIRPVSDAVVVGANVSQSHIDNVKNSKVSSDAANKTQTAPPVSIPVKQKEYRRPDGRRRIIPEAVGLPAQQEIMGDGQAQNLDFPLQSSNHRKDENGRILVDMGAKEAHVKGSTTSGNAYAKDRSGITARATISESLIIEKVPVTAGSDGHINIELGGGSGNAPSSGSSTSSAGTLSIRVFDKKGGDSVPVGLQAHPREQTANDVFGMGNASVMKETEIVCIRDGQTLWSDRISGKVTVLAGNINFWAVGCEDGSLQIYTKCGRRAMPTMMIGSAAVFIDCDENWKLLLVTRKGTLYIWDLYNRKCLLHDSLGSIVASDIKSASKDAGTIKVISARLSKCGSPLVILATRHAFLFDLNLLCWLRVADDCFPASNFVSSLNLGSSQSAELAALQVDIKKFLARKPGFSRATDDGVQTRAHLETQMASALALKSPNEYRQCLLSYVRFLAREADESRLREVCESFLGPPPNGMNGMMPESAATSSNSEITAAWDPSVLGMKKHKLLREDILPAMASNRKVQRLLNEFMDILSEYGIDETRPEQKHDQSCQKQPPQPTQEDPMPMEVVVPPCVDDQMASTELLQTTNNNNSSKVEAIPELMHIDKVVPSSSTNSLLVVTEEASSNAAVSGNIETKS